MSGRRRLTVTTAVDVLVGAMGAVFVGAMGDVLTATAVHPGTVAPMTTQMPASIAPMNTMGNQSCCTNCIMPALPKDSGTTDLASGAMSLL